jgi:uncharacterized protein (TIGR03089 family)
VVTLARDVVTALPTRGAAPPLLTWYGPDGERVDLSPRVLGTWVAKAVDLLVTEADAGPHTHVALDLPVHWRTVVWALAAWTTGARVDLPRGDAAAGAPAPPDVNVTDAPEPADGGLVVAVPLPALALRWPGALPPGVLDGVADLLGRPDALGWLPPVHADAPALVGVRHADLLTHARQVAGAAAWPTAPRVLRGHDEPATAVLLAALAAWDAGGSVVLLGPGSPDATHVADVERVTVGA